MYVSENYSLKELKIVWQSCLNHQVAFYNCISDLPSTYFMEEFVLVYLSAQIDRMVDKV